MMTSSLKSEKPTKSSRKQTLIAQRYIIGFLGFLALINAELQRFSLSLVITEMTKYADNNLVLKSIDDRCPRVSNFLNKTRSQPKPWQEFKWDEKKQGMILSSIFWGYVIGQLPGGMIANRFGGKYTLACGMFVSILCNLMLPFVTYQYDFVGLIVVRFFTGLGQSPLYPSLNVILSHWSPGSERARLGSLVFAGAQLGSIVSMGATGIIMDKFGWTSVFYIYGLIGVFWYIAWIAFVSDTPTSHPFISIEEKMYLQQTVTGVTTARENLPPTPWKDMLTSAPVWGVIIAQCGHDWGIFTIMTDLPKYLQNVLHFSVETNGELSALPLLNMWVFALISGVICDWLITKKEYNITIVRKIFVTIASVGPALGLVAASYSKCNRIAVITWLAIGIGLMGAFVPSLKINALDLSPNFAGSLMALIGGIGAIPGMMAPYVVGSIIEDETLTEWKRVFWITFYILVATNIVYLIFGSGEVQPWNERPRGDLSKNEITEIVVIEKAPSNSREIDSIK